MSKTFDIIHTLYFLHCIKLESYCYFFGAVSNFEIRFDVRAIELLSAIWTMYFYDFTGKVI
jgi:hypothetical protein